MERCWVVVRTFGVFLGWLWDLVGLRGSLVGSYEAVWGWGSTTACS